MPRTHYVLARMPRTHYVLARTPRTHYVLARTHYVLARTHTTIFMSRTNYSSRDARLKQTFSHSWLADCLSDLPFGLLADGTSGWLFNDHAFLASLCQKCRDCFDRVCHIDLGERSIWTTS